MSEKTAINLEKFLDETILEPTGTIVVHNYPPRHSSTYSYITLTYYEYKRNSLGRTLVDGEPIYFHDLPEPLRRLAKVMGEVQECLFQELKNGEQCKKQKKSEK